MFTYDSSSSFQSSIRYVGVPCDIAAKSYTQALNDLLFLWNSRPAFALKKNLYDTELTVNATGQESQLSHKITWMSVGIQLNVTEKNNQRALTSSNELF